MSELRVTDEMVDAGAAAAFFQDDLGGHIAGRWTWETIPEEGRANYRMMVRAAVEAALQAGGFTDMLNALRLLAAVYYDETLHSDTSSVEYDDLFNRGLLNQSRDITDEYTTALTPAGYKFVVTQLNRAWREVVSDDE